MKETIDILGEAMAYALNKSLHSDVRKKLNAAYAHYITYKINQNSRDDIRCPECYEQLAKYQSRYFCDNVSHCTRALTYWYHVKSNGTLSQYLPENKVVRLVHMGAK